MAFIFWSMFLCVVCILGAFGNPVIFTNGVAEKRHQHVQNPFIPSQFNGFADVDYVLLPDLSQNFDSFDYDSGNFESNVRRFSSNSDFKSTVSEEEGNDETKATSQSFFGQNIFGNKKIETERQNGFSEHSQSSFFFEFPQLPIRNVITEELSRQPGGFFHIPPVSIIRPFGEKPSQSHTSSFHKLPTVEVSRPFVKESPSQAQSHSFQQLLTVPVRRPFEDLSSQPQTAFQQLPTVSVKKPLKEESSHQPQTPPNQFLTVPVKTAFIDELSGQPQAPSFHQLPTVPVEKPLTVASSNQPQSSSHQLQTFPVSKPTKTNPSRSELLLSSIIGGIRKDIFNNQNPINQIDQQPKELHKHEPKISKELTGPLQVLESIPISTIVKFPDNQNSHLQDQPTVSRSQNLLTRIIKGIDKDIFSNQDRRIKQSSSAPQSLNIEERSRDIITSPSQSVEKRIASEGLEQVPRRLEQVPGRLEQIPGKLEQVPERLEQVPGRLEQIPGRLEQIPERLEQVPGRLEQVPKSQHFQNEQQQNQDQSRSQKLLDNIMSSIQRDIFDSEKFE